MALKYWVGTTSGHEGEGDWGPNWLPTGVPAEGDDVVIGATGSQPMTSGLTAANAWRHLKVVNGAGQIGSLASNLVVNITGNLIYSGTGKLYLDVGTGTTYPIAYLSNSSGTKSDLQLKGDWNRIVATKGAFTLVSGAITDLYMQYLSALASDAQCEIDEAELTNVWGIAGSLLLSGDGSIANLEQAGMASTIQEGTVTNLVQWGGNTVWNSAETLTLARLHGGAFNASADIREKTITALEMYGAATANLNNMVGNITIGTLTCEGLNRPTLHGSQSVS